MKINGTTIEIGTLEDEGGAIGVVVRGEGGRLITIKGLSEDQARAMAPSFSEAVTINVTPI